MSERYLKNGETLKLDADSCVGCGDCVDVCPHAVFRLEAGKAHVDRRWACMECGACALNCQAGAITVKAGVGCAGAIILGKLTGKAPSCGGEDSSCCGAAAEEKRPRRAKTGACC